MTTEEKGAVCEAVLHLGQISAALACIRVAMNNDRDAVDAIGMVETFAEWAATKLDTIQL